MGEPGSASRRRPLPITSEAALAAAGRPWLWPVALRQGLSLAERGWWRSWPPLPRPSPDYLAFRLQTMYGERPEAMGPEDLLGYLRWCRRMRSLAR